MIIIQYEPTKGLFRIKSSDIKIWRTLRWLQTYVAHRGINYDFQTVIDNPQREFIL
jgi:hypothetical protein